MHFKIVFMLALVIDIEIIKAIISFFTHFS